MKATTWALALALGLSACSTGVESVSSGTETVTGATEEEEGTKVPTFGDVVTFADKSTLTCGKPVEFKPDQYAIGGEDSPVHLKVKCTFTNQAAEVFNPALTTLSMTAGDTEGDSVFMDGLDAPDNPVRTGRSVTWWSGWGVPSKKDVQVAVDLGLLDYQTVIFAG